MLSIIVIALVIISFFIALKIFSGDMIYSAGEMMLSVVLSFVVMVATALVSMVLIILPVTIYFNEVESITADQIDSEGYTLSFEKKNLEISYDGKVYKVSYQDIHYIGDDELDKDKLLVVETDRICPATLITSTHTELFISAYNSDLVSSLESSLAYQKAMDGKNERQSDTYKIIRGNDGKIKEIEGMDVKDIDLTNLHFTVKTSNEHKLSINENDKAGVDAGNDVDEDDDAQGSEE